MDWLKSNWKGLAAAVIVVALIVTSFIPAAAGVHDQILVLAATLGLGGTALLDPFIAKKKPE